MKTHGEMARRAAGAVDQDRLWRRLMRLGEIGATAKGGVNRPALSPADAAARRLLIDWAGELGLAPATDEIGNLYLRRPGAEADAPPVMTGSHIDSQPRGGKFDGAYGVVAGFEALEAMTRAGVETRRPVDVVAWTNEEGSRFQPGTMGSGVFCGEMALAEVLAVHDRDGVTVAEALARTLAETPGLERRERGFPLAAYVEAHIEQGPRLEADGKTIGVVTAVQGLRWFTVEVTGEEGHAGTMPLAMRKDALRAAVEMVTALQGLMADPSDTVRFTVGRFEVEPGSPNTVPGRVTFTIDFRHPDRATLARLGDRVEAVCQAHARGCAVKVTPTTDIAPVAFDEGIVDTVRDHAEGLGLPHMDMPSGAGHDAMLINRLCPAGMIFIPCERGISHNEAENATPEHSAAGARVLAAVLTDLANRS